jgi:hypothetical protein
MAKNNDYDINNALVDLGEKSDEELREILDQLCDEEELSLIHISEPTRPY